MSANVLEHRVVEPPIHLVGNADRGVCDDRLVQADELIGCVACLLLVRHPKGGAQ
jgi:hypothetical protein